MFESGREMLAEVAAMASTEVEFHCARAGKVHSLPARIGSKMFRTYDGAAAVAVTCLRFIVCLADLAGFPNKADFIVWKGRKYSLGCPDGGPPWRWHGSDCTNIAIFATDEGEQQ